MLVFHDNNQSYNTADTVHFAALTPNDSFFKYSYNGITGKYFGYFIREAFFKKIYEYNTKEQRYMYLYTLNYNQKEILMLIYHLYELGKATFKYYFTDGNCASYISDFLSIVEKNNIDTTSLYYLPINTVKDYNHRIINKDRYIPLLNKIYLLFSRMTIAQQRDFLNIIKNNSSPQINLDDIVKEALVDYYTFYFRKFHISYKNYNDVINLKYNKTYTSDLTKDPLNKTQPSNLKVAYKDTNNESSLLLGYRPYYADLNDIQNNQIQESEFAFLDSTLSIDKKKIKLDELKILSIKSFNVYTDFYSPMSWQFYSGINKKNYENTLKLNNEVGFGVTTNIVSNLNIGTLLNIGFDNFEAYAKPSLYLYHYIFKNNKIKVESNYKRYLDDTYYENIISSINKIDNYVLSLHFSNNRIENSLIFEIKYNF